MYSTSWEQSNNGGKRKDTQIEALLPNNNQHSDSFFNRVFGHHSPESSRGKGSCFAFPHFLSLSLPLLPLLFFYFSSFFLLLFSSNYFNILTCLAGSPIPPPLNQQTLKSETAVEKSSSYQYYNSSTDTTPLSVTVPYLSTATILTSDLENRMQRRRSFNGQTSDTNSLKPKPVPTASVSARVSPIPSGREAQNSTVPYPRGGTHIGANEDCDSLVRRSNSIDHGQFRLEGKDVFLALSGVFISIVLYHRASTKETAFLQTR